MSTQEPGLEVLSEYDVDGRLEIAQRCRQPLNRLALLVGELSSSKTTIDSLDKIDQAVAIMDELRPPLRTARGEYGQEKGPRVLIPGHLNPRPAFVEFVAGWTRAATAIAWITRDREHRGDTGWLRYSQEAVAFRYSLRCLSSFVMDMERAGWCIPPAQGNRGVIPHDKRTRPMSKVEALNYIGWPGHAEEERQAVDWLTQSIRDGEYRWEPVNRKKGVYHVDDFPAECRDKIRLR